MITHVLKYGLLSLVVFVVPLFANATFTPPATTPPLKSVKLQLLLDGKPLTKGTLNVAKDTVARLSWKTAEGTKGCVNNWSSLTDPANSSDGQFTESRYFIITCYGIGTAQSAKLRVNVTYPDLSVSSVKINGLGPVMTADGTKVKKNTYKASVAPAPAFTIRAMVKNAGGLPSQASNVTYAYGIAKDGDKDKIVETIVTQAPYVKSLGVIPKGGSVPIEIPIPASAHPGIYYRVIVDPEGKVDEGTKENNNSSKWFGPFIFE